VESLLAFWWFDEKNVVFYEVANRINVSLGTE